jgi:hypothetical protein
MGEESAFNAERAALSSYRVPGSLQRSAAGDGDAIDGMPRFLEVIVALWSDGTLVSECGHYTGRVMLETHAMSAGASDPLWEA